ncbi:unnamed protein product [Parajaminaea phylloscopi]
MASASPPPPPPADESSSAAPPPPPADVSKAESQTTKGSPNDFLKNVIGKRVAVRLNSGIDYRGTLSCLDGYMNIALEETSEWVAGVEKNRFGDAFIRGNNGEAAMSSTSLSTRSRWTRLADSLTLPCRSLARHAPLVPQYCILRSYRFSIQATAHHIDLMR